MKTYQVEVAQPIGDDVPPDAQILITRNGWRATRSVEELRTGFDRDARVIAEALFGSLPGGTLDRLLAFMLERKASSLIVRERDLRDCGLVDE